MILLIRDNECFEPRVKNYLGFFDTHNIPYRVIGWNRNGTAETKAHFSFYQRQAEYGKRIANIPNKIGWMVYAAKEAYIHRKEYEVIHACDMDAAFPVLLLGKLLKKRIVFDVFDWMSSDNESGLVYKVVEWMQNFCYKYADAVILCEEERRIQASAHNNTVFIIPNIPNVNIAVDSYTSEKISKDLAAYDCVLSYVGVFDHDRGLENLLEVVSQESNLKLNIAGFGALGELVQRYAEKYPNITYWGRVEYSVGQTIQKNSNLIVAMYYLSNPVHKFAAPNKYYESLALGVPMITTQNTLVGTKVEKFDTGFVLDERAESLLELLRSPKLKTQLAAKKTNCTDIWERVYKDYYETYMREQYMRFVNEVN